jgi:hypothetical protein
MPRQGRERSQTSEPGQQLGMAVDDVFAEASTAVQSGAVKSLATCMCICEDTLSDVIDVILSREDESPGRRY